MRLDKFLSVNGCCSRSEAKRFVRLGGVFVNGFVPKSSDASVDPEKDVIVFQGKRVFYRKHVYIMLNKPEGYVSATEDGREKTVLDLLPQEARWPRRMRCPTSRTSASTAMWVTACAVASRTMS